jgi:glutathione S-transferase
MLPNLEKFVPYFERIIKDSGSGFVGRSGVSYVDFHIAEWMLSLYGFEKELLDSKYPILVQHFQRVEALPELQEYSGLSFD